MYKILVAVLASIVLLACSEKSIDEVSAESVSTAVAKPQQETAEVAKVDVIKQVVPEKQVQAAPLVIVPAGKYVAGKHYRVLARPLPTHNPNKVEVAEFFWYGCGHCYTFESLVKPYKRDLPDSIEFVGIPAMWRDVMTVHAKAYFAAQALKKPELHEAMFVALNVERKKLASEAEVANLFAEHGVDKVEALKLLSSFGISAQVNKARSMAAGAKLTGTPTLMVNGKYVVESSMAGSQAEMLKVADYLAKLEVSR